MLRSVRKWGNSLPINLAALEAKIISGDPKKLAQFVNEGCASFSEVPLFAFTPVNGFLLGKSTHKAFDFC